jgi:rubredoxin
MFIHQQHPVHKRLVPSEFGICGLEPAFIHRSYPRNCRKGKRGPCPARQFLSKETTRLENQRRHARNVADRKASDPDLKDRLRHAFGDLCQYCGGHTDQGQPDRIIPGAKGGKYTAANVTLACPECNQRKQAGEAYGPVRSLADMEARS